MATSKSPPSTREPSSIYGGELFDVFTDTDTHWLYEHAACLSGATIVASELSWLSKRDILCRVSITKNGT
ncbi:hypothetical protein A1QG_10410 [Vibrio breoganii ZF-29]|nr:hypothetical protein A1QG_10410 [Vibrio breoganii ZF-29]